MITEMKIHLLILFIFLSSIELEFLQICFLLLFHHFYPKIDSSAHFDSVFSNIGQFNRKKKSTVQFCNLNIRISVILIHLRSKLTSEIWQKVERLEERNRAKLSQSKHFGTFFIHKTTSFIKKQKILIDYLLQKEVYLQIVRGYDKKCPRKYVIK